MRSLLQAERRLLSGVKTRLEGKMIPVRQGQGEVWTISGGGEDASKAPLVMIHGFGGGVGLWAQNLDALAAKRRVYAFDLLGFARSSRPRFSREGALAEAEWIASIEDWRRQMKLSKIILLGHSFGGYLSASYALEYPENVRHLILVDPWGFPDRPDRPGPGEEGRNPKLPTWVRAVARVVSLFNPLSGLRAVGPAGPGMVKKFRPDLGRRFAGEGDEGPDEQAVYDYIYHCNAQSPTGEAGFKSLNESFGWAKRPMGARLAAQLRPGLPLTFVYGERSWMDSASGYNLRDARSDLPVNVKVIPDAGHHVYADRPKDFNDAVIDIFGRVDSGSDQSSASV